MHVTGRKQSGFRICLAWNILFCRARIPRILRLAYFLFRLAISTRPEIRVRILLDLPHFTLRFKLRV